MMRIIRPKFPVTSLLWLALGVTLLLIFFNKRPPSDPTIEIVLEVQNGLAENLRKLNTPSIGKACLSCPESHSGIEIYDESSIEATLRPVLQKRASSDGTIIVVVLASGEEEVARNLYETLLAPYGHKNYVFVAAEKSACDQLLQYHIYCAVFEPAANERLDDETDEAVKSQRLAKLRLSITLSALLVRLNVFSLKPDSVAFSDAVFLLQKSRSKTNRDLCVSSKEGQPSASFYWAEPTTDSVSLFGPIRQMLTADSSLDPQRVFIEKLNSLRAEGSLRVTLANNLSFPDATMYFEHGKRMFAAQKYCRQCAMLHDVALATPIATEYRLKEAGLWSVDQKGYYTDPSTKYLVYVNLKNFKIPEVALKHEIEGLKSALAIGRLLNRVVVLPHVHCAPCDALSCQNSINKCTFGTHIRIEPFHRQFAGLYRESSFFDHPMLPSASLRSKTKMFCLGSPVMEQTMQYLNQDIVQMKPASIDAGAQPDEILQWLDSVDEHVLRLFMLYDVVRDFSHPQYGDLIQRFDAAFRLV